MVKETGLYDVLDVAPQATEIELKKAYRKMAIKYHPDKNSDPAAEAKFKDVGEAYQLLSNPDTRAFYDRYGKAKLNEVAADGEMEMQDPAALFGSLFGGERFKDLIGEISLVKDFASTMDVYMTEEERAEMEADGMAMPGLSKPAGAAASGSPEGSAAKIATDPQNSEASTAGIPQGNVYPAPAGVAAGSTPAAATTTWEEDHNGHVTLHVGESASLPSGVASGSTTPVGGAGKKDSMKPPSKNKLTPEQRAKLAALDAEKEKARQERVDTLYKNLITRIRPFVEAKHPGDANDAETIAFENKTRLEAEDLKLESFGVELLHTIGNVYIQKATTFVRSKKFLGGGFFSRLKEKGSMLKEGWGVLGSAIGVQMAMEEMAKMEAKGDASQEELEAMAADLSSKLLLTTWKGTRWEVISILGEVVDKVLYEPGLTKDVALNRAKAIMTVGGVFKATIPDESDEERREIERIVLNAGSKKKAKDKKAHDEKAKSSSSGLFGWGSKKGSSPPTPPVMEEKVATPKKAV